MVPVSRGSLRQFEESLDEEDARVADLSGAVGVLLGGEVEAALEHVLVPLAVGEPGAGREGEGKVVCIHFFFFLMGLAKKLNYIIAE